MKVAIIGSKKYENKLKIKNFIFSLKEKFGDNLEIVTGGNIVGADLYAKKYSKLFGIKYSLFVPSHERWQLHCIEPQYMFNKEYKASNFFINNNKIYKYSDIIVIFKYDDDNTSDYMDLINKKKQTKKLIVIN